jgi:hypothetical protein
MRTFLFCVLTLISTVSWANTTIVIVSPYQSKEMAKHCFSEIIKLYADLPLGSGLVVINGETAETITSLNVPDKPYFKHSKIRIKAVRKELAALKKFTESVSLGNRTDGAMDFPRVIHSVARHYPSDKDIILFGISVLYDVPSQPGLNTTFGHVLSDGFFFATASDTPFGTIGRENLLKNKRIHWALSPNTPQDSQHLDSLTRFWHLYIHLLGGSLVSFTGDMDAVVRLYLNNAVPLNMSYKADPEAKRELVMTKTYVLDMSLFDTPSSQLATKSINFEERHSPILAIEWNAVGVDLDIYARADDERIVYFASSPTRSVSHYKDMITGSTEGQHTKFETIEYHEPIDLNSLKIVVNAYRITEYSEVVTGTLHVKVDDQHYTRSFSFAPDSANEGDDAKDVLSSSISSKHSLYFSAANIISDNVEVAQ